MPNFLQSAICDLDTELSATITGKVSTIIGLIIECKGIKAPIGSICEIQPSFGNKPIKAEVVGLKSKSLLLMPYGDILGINKDDKVVCLNLKQTVNIGDEILGRILDASGKTIDNKPDIVSELKYGIYASPPPAMSRKQITEPIATGIKAIDALLTCGKGQRIGLFSGSGVGKSILMGMIARNTNADVNVICLVGERGREVKEFIERDLGEEGLKRSVVIVATSDEPTLMRTKAPFTASAIAEYFRDKGNDVLLMMDSITRMSNAQREIGLSIGEPPATKGYPPSTFAQMPKLLERAGTSPKGSITGIYTVLVEADDINEPIADTARGILDGHIWLSRNLASKGHFPAIDILTSISRLMIQIVTKEHYAAAIKLRSVIHTYNEAEDMINIGAYTKGANKEIDYAISMINKINSFLKQDIFEKISYKDTVEQLINIINSEEK